MWMAVSIAEIGTSGEGQVWRDFRELHLAMLSFRYQQSVFVFVKAEIQYPFTITSPNFLFYDF